MTKLIIDYTEAQLNSTTHSQVRLIASSIGIKSPTSKDKATLIQQIILAQKGELPCDELKSGKSSAGRPRKNEIVKISIGDCSDLIGMNTIENKDGKLNMPLQESFVASAEDTTLDKDTTLIEGVLQVLNDGYGFLRVNNYYQSDNDIYVPAPQILRFNLRSGDYIKGKARSYSNTRQPSLIFVESVNNIKCADLKKRQNFDDLIPTYPTERLRLEVDSNRLDYSLRAIDLVAPIGKGQRGLIVSPPKAGKTVLLKKMAQAIISNYPSLTTIILLIDERPEEVTDIKESVSCEVAYSTFDQTPTHHIEVADLVFKRARRMVESGQDVVILMDSITRLARAYNQTAELSGRTLSGGLDVSALYEPKKFFGSGRKIKDGGSLTIIATALVDTGSKMDDIIYEEFKGTGNMEIHLDRRMSERRIFPAIDLNRSGTRREDLLLNNKELEGMFMLRKALGKNDNVEVTEQIVEMLTHTRNNSELIDQLHILKW